MSPATEDKSNDRAHRLGAQSSAHIRHRTTGAPRQGAKWARASDAPASRNSRPAVAATRSCASIFALASPRRACLVEIRGLATAFASHSCGGARGPRRGGPRPRIQGLSRRSLPTMREGGADAARGRRERVASRREQYASRASGARVDANDTRATRRAREPTRRAREPTRRVRVPTRMVRVPTRMVREPTRMARASTRPVRAVADGSRALDAYRPAGS